MAIQVVQVQRLARHDVLRVGSGLEGEGGHRSCVEVGRVADGVRGGNPEYDPTGVMEKALKSSSRGLPVTRTCLTPTWASSKTS